VQQEYPLAENKLCRKFLESSEPSSGRFTRHSLNAFILRVPESVPLRGQPPINHSFYQGDSVIVPTPDSCIMEPWMYANDPNQLASPEAHSAAAGQTVRDAQRMLGTYPFASATPTHPGTHLEVKFDFS
jgi:hypothetical protein